MTERKAEKYRQSYNNDSRQYNMIMMIGIFVIIAIILLGSSIHAFANSRKNQPTYKYFTSVRIEAGDTLWNIATQYGTDTRDTKAYIHEICQLNKINENEIRAGDYIVVPYYSTDLKE